MRRGARFWGQLAFTLLVCAFLIVPVVMSVLAGVTENFFVGLKSGLTLRWIGEVRFSGPGAPKVACTPPSSPPLIETSTKSCALSFVSCGAPVVSLRAQLYCASETKPKFCATPAPSRRSADESVPPTASRRCPAVQFAGSLVRKRARPAKGASAACV